MTNPTNSDAEQIKVLQSRITSLVNACVSINAQVKADAALYSKRIENNNYVPLERIQALQQNIEKFVLATIAQVQDAPDRNDYINRRMNPRSFRNR